LLLWLLGIFDVGAQTVRNEGVRALWKGLTPFAGNLTVSW